MIDRIWPKTVLFTDLRHIECGNLRWLSPTGEDIPVAGPPEPEVDAYAQLGMLPRGVRLVAQKPTKTDPIPQEGNAGFTRVIYDSGLYRSWNLSVTYPSGSNLGSYSKEHPAKVEVVSTQSNDAINWTEHSRSTIDVAGITGFDGFTYFIDPHGPSEERYKIVYCANPPEEEASALLQAYSKLHPRHQDRRIFDREVKCMYTIVSPDGIQWKAVRKPLFVHHSDTDTTVFWDEWLEKYVMYTRIYPTSRRAIGKAESADFYNWNPIEPLVSPQLEWSITDDVYLNAFSRYPYSPGYRFMFPMIYHRFDQSSDIRMYSSADSVTWNEIPGGPIITPGEPGSWDSEFITVGKDLVPLGADRVAVPYHGTRYPHKYPRWKSLRTAHQTGWVWWPKGRLSAIKADEEGEFFTFSLPPAGRSLNLNVNVRRGGVARVEVVGIEGRTIADCAPITTDGLKMPVSWNGQTDIGSPDKAPVTLHFKLRSAELFGFEWV